MFILPYIIIIIVRIVSLLLSYINDKYGRYGQRYKFLVKIYTNCGILNLPKNIEMTVVDGTITLISQ